MKASNSSKHWVMVALIEKLLGARMHQDSEEDCRFFPVFLLFFFFFSFFSFLCLLFFLWSLRIANASSTDEIPALTKANNQLKLQELRLPAPSSVDRFCQHVLQSICISIDQTSHRVMVESSLSSGSTIIVYAEDPDGIASEAPEACAICWADLNGHKNWKGSQVGELTGKLGCRASGLTNFRHYAMAEQLTPAWRFRSFFTDQAEDSTSPHNNWMYARDTVRSSTHAFVCKLFCQSKARCLQG